VELEPPIQHGANVAVTDNILVRGAVRRCLRRRHGLQTD
jgi:hypothetical protein